MSSLINNSTSELDVSASCDGENVIGFTAGEFQCRVHDGSLYTYLFKVLLALAQTTFPV